MSAPCRSSGVAEGQAADEVDLAELDAVVAEDRVGGDEVEAVVREGELEHVVAAREDLAGHPGERDRAGLSALEVGRLEAVHVLADRADAFDIRPGAGEDLERLVAGLEVHRQRRAQVVEARMHFAGNGAAMRARHAIRWQQPGVRQGFSEILGNRERVPHRHPVVHETRHQHRRR